MITVNLWVMHTMCIFYAVYGENTLSAFPEQVYLRKMHMWAKQGSEHAFAHSSSGSLVSSLYLVLHLIDKESSDCRLKHFAFYKNRFIATDVRPFVLVTYFTAKSSAWNPLTVKLQLLMYFPIPDTKTYFYTVKKSDSLWVYNLNLNPSCCSGCRIVIKAGPNRNPFLVASCWRRL